MFLGLVFLFFATVAVVMLFVIKPLADYLEYFTTVPRLVVYGVIFLVTITLPLILVRGFHTIAQRKSLYPEHLKTHTTTHNKVTDSD